MASRGLGTLTLDLVAKIGGFVGPLSKAERELDKRTKAMQARATAFGKALGGAIVVGAGAAAAGLVSITKKAIDSADRLNDISERLGVGTEALSAWGYAAQQSGTDLEALNTGLTRFTKNVAAAVDTSSRQGEIFKALGVSVKDAAGNLRSVEDLLPEVATAFKSLNNATLEASLAQELFGRSGANLLQFLNLGGDGLSEMEERARALGIVISKDTAKAADEFNDQLADLKALVSGLGIQLAAELLPALTQLIQDLKDAAQEGGGLETAMDAVRVIFETTTGVASILSNTLKGVTEDLKAVGSAGMAAWAVLNGNFAGAAGYLKQAGEHRAAAAEASRNISGTMFGREQRTGPIPNLQVPFLQPLFPQFSAVPTGLTTPQGGGNSQAERDLMKLLENNKPKKGGSKKAKKEGKSDEEREAEQLKAAYDRLNESLAEQIALHGKTGEAVQIRYDLEHGELSKLTQAQKDGLIVQAERIDQLNAEADVQKELDAINERRAEAVAQVLEDIQTEVDLLGTSIEHQDTYNKLKYAGVDANSAFGQSIIDANHALHEQAEATGRNIELMDEFRGGLVDGLTDIVTGAKSAKEAFKDFFDDMAAKILRMIAEQWIEKAFGQMGTSGSGSGTSGGNWIGAIFGALFGGGKASGGGVQPGMFYQVNENGPEMLSVGGRDYLMMGSQAGKVTPHAAASAAGTTVNQAIYVTGTVSPYAAQQMQQQAAMKQGRSAQRNR